MRNPLTIWHSLKLNARLSVAAFLIGLVATIVVGAMYVFSFIAHPSCETGGLGVFGAFMLYFSLTVAYLAAK